MSIEGTPFCSSAKKAFMIIVENSLRVAAINSVGDFLLFIAKVVVSLLSVVIAIFWLQVPIDQVFLF